MTQDASNIPTMPDRSQLVSETIRRFDSSSDRPSSLLALSDPDLFDTGLLLSDRSLPTAEALRQVNKLLGGTEEKPVVARSSFYRFADRFKSLYGQIEAEYARRIARLSIDHATDQNIRAMTNLGRNRLAELAAEKLVSADSIDDVEKTLSKLAAIVTDAEQGQLKADKLELDKQQYERQMRETIAKLDLAEKRAAEMQQRIDAKEREVEKQKQAAQKAVEAASKVAESGGTNDDVVNKVRDILGLPQPTNSDGSEAAA